jgi:hypothetical protein
MNNLVRMVSYQRKYEEAEQMYQQLLKLRRRGLGEDIQKHWKVYALLHTCAVFKLGEEPIFFS